MKTLTTTINHPIIRGITIVLGLCLIWQAVVSFGHLPIYILPGPVKVLTTWFQQSSFLLKETIPTVIETLLGLLLGSIAGIIFALGMTYFKPIRLWFLPILLISQALPTFAIAPLLVVWFGYGMTAKIITTMIMLFFPVANAFYDGLNSTPQGWIDLAQTMRAKKWCILWHIKIPAALPSLATGLRVATAIAPIGAIVSEWVGSSKGLGFVMLNANARMQIDVMFAALLTLCVFTLILYLLSDIICKKWLAKNI